MTKIIYNGRGELTSWGHGNRLPDCKCFITVKYNEEFNTVILRTKDGTVMGDGKIKHILIEKHYIRIDYKNGQTYIITTDYEVNRI